MDAELMQAITDSYPDKRDANGRMQATISSSERIRLQEKFKLKIFYLLKECLSVDPFFAPAYLLYPEVAQHNSRASDRVRLIKIYEVFAPMIDDVKQGSAGYVHLQNDIAGMGGNFYHKVERHLADFYNSLAALYHKEGMDIKAKESFRKAVALCPEVFGRGKNKLSPF